MQGEVDFAECALAEYLSDSVKVNSCRWSHTRLFKICLDMLGELFGGFRAWTQVFVCDGVLSFKTLAWVDLQMVLLVRGQLVNASERLLVIS